MVLPCNDPRDAAGLERGLREFSDAAGMPLTLYLKDELGFGADRAAGLDAVRPIGGERRVLRHQVRCGPQRPWPGRLPCGTARAR